MANYNIKTLFEAIKEAFGEENIIEFIAMHNRYPQHRKQTDEGGIFIRLNTYEVGKSGEINEIIDKWLNTSYPSYTLMHRTFEYEHTEIKIFVPLPKELKIPQSLKKYSNNPVQQGWFFDLYQQIEGEFDDGFDIANLIAAHEKFAKWLTEEHFKITDPDERDLVEDARQDWPKQNDPFIYPQDES